MQTLENSNQNLYESTGSQHGNTPVNQTENKDCPENLDQAADASFSSKSASNFDELQAINENFVEKESEMNLTMSVNLCTQKKNSDSTPPSTETATSTANANSNANATSMPVPASVSEPVASEPQATHAAQPPAINVVLPPAAPTAPTAPAAPNLPTANSPAATPNVPASLSLSDVVSLALERVTALERSLAAMQTAMNAQANDVHSLHVILAALASHIPDSHKPTRPQTQNASGGQ